MISPTPNSLNQPLFPSPFSDHHHNHHRKTNMAEEQKWQEHNHVLCANNCGFFGSPTTLNLCSKCYKHHCLNQQQISTAKIALDNTLIQPPHPIPPQSSSSSSSSAAVVPVSVFPTDTHLKSSDPAAVDKPLQRNRCGSCRKRVGLTGFRCRCGEVFCGMHRYPEKHECSFDFKTVGKEAIAKANPVVKAEKLHKI